MSHGTVNFLILTKKSAFPCFGVFVSVHIFCLALAVFLGLGFAFAGTVRASMWA